ncbi:MAG: UDP-4-amino-4,6-dideoxy-N-acetyl-beta-L-altrosamine transaminase [Christensenellaceae bacterium]|jgi:UDP-4-amino-4,6-dideoxy-N-acetyl-beta-L-altrosamine transaminase
MEKLAIFGGKPVRDTYLAYGRQYIDDDDVRAVADVLRSDFLTCGPKVTELESALCKLAGAQYATVVSNGTAALHVACLAAGIGPGDEVVVPPITFAATANSVLYCGGTPVFADIDIDTWQLSVNEAEKAITNKTKAIITVDYTGQTGELIRLKQLCEKYNLTMIEDAAHSIGTTYMQKPVGSIADLTTFSFHPVKTVTSGEGGAVLTNSADMKQKLELFAKHGITRNSDLIHDHSNSNWYYEELLLGYNYRLTDIQCALLISQLQKLPDFATRRAEITNQYNEAFSGMDELTLQKPTDGCVPVRHLYVIRLNTAKLSAGRKEVYDALQAENIGVNVHYIPTYHFPYYRENGYADIFLKNTEALYAEMITLPLYYAMTDRDAADVIAAVKKVLRYYKREV